LLEPGAILLDGPNGPAPPTTTDVCIDLTVRPVAHDDERRELVRDAYRTAPKVVERAARALFMDELPGEPALKIANVPDARAGWSRPGAKEGSVGPAGQERRNMTAGGRALPAGRARGAVVVEILAALC
jgi:hypothetical protein